MKPSAATFSITHSGTCELLDIYVNEERMTSVLPGHTFNATVAALHTIAVQCSQNCSGGECFGKLNIKVHFLLKCGEDGSLDNKSFICFLSDKDGNQQDVHDTNVLSYKELCKKSGRDTIPFHLPEGGNLTLYKSDLEVKGYLTLKVFEDDGTLCTKVTFPFSCLTPIYLYAPDGTNLKVQLSDFSCESFVSISRKNCSHCLTINICIHLCLSIQSIAYSKVTVTGAACKPRLESRFNCK
ncbi:hypothetical protein LF822_09450 [Halobacillus sp. A5]|nr:S-Ena type endospore appendage [Halobacillus sp. A5]MCP3027160.1 hypothetical protein [Halobacillus sp. A5]